MPAAADDAMFGSGNPSPAPAMAGMTGLRAYLETIADSRQTQQFPANEKDSVALLPKLNHALQQRNGITRAKGNCCVRLRLAA